MLRGRWRRKLYWICTLLQMPAYFGLVDIGKSFDMGKKLDKIAHKIAMI